MAGETVEATNPAFVPGTADPIVDPFVAGAAEPIAAPFVAGAAEPIAAPFVAGTALEKPTAAEVVAASAWTALLLRPAAVLPMDAVGVPLTDAMRTAGAGGVPLVADAVVLTGTCRPLRREVVPAAESFVALLPPGGAIAALLTAGLALLDVV
ncbi:MAG: hypothetical protein ACYCW6_30135 [Candidatus Xenobia bacterium]